MPAGHVCRYGLHPSTLHCFKKTTPQLRVTSHPRPFSPSSPPAPAHLLFACPPDCLPACLTRCLQIDVEGYELQALKGMRRWLNSANGPRFLRIEFNVPLMISQGYGSLDLLSLLQECGYETPLSPGSSKADLLAFSAELDRRGMIDLNFYKTAHHV